MQIIFNVFIFKDIIKRIKSRGQEQHTELVRSRCRSETGTGAHPGRDISLSPPSEGGCEDYRRYYTQESNNLAQGQEYSKYLIRVTEKPTVQ